jgi:hypothetical protein
VCVYVCVFVCVCVRACVRVRVCVHSNVECTQVINEADELRVKAACSLFLGAQFVLNLLALPV